MITEPLSAQYACLQTNAQRMHDTLQLSCQWGNTDDGGMNRLSGNDDDKKVRDWFMAETAKYGCTHKIDTMGNIFAIRPGQNNNLPPIGLGSHLDTQPTGGKYDGILGVCCGLEVLKTIHENNVTTYAPLAIINWTNEEGARFAPAMLGSGVWGGVYSNDFAHNATDADGIILKQELDRIGYVGKTPCSYEANSLLAHFEVHIEQGPILDAAQKPVGLVKSVQSMKWYQLDLKGRSAHTGSTPMDRRSDTLLAAAKMIVAVNEVVSIPELAARGTRGTIAVINSLPQSTNTISGEVTMNLDLRCPDDSGVADLERLCSERFDLIANEHGITFSMKPFWQSPATYFDEQMKDCIRASASRYGCSHEIIAGAGHDSVFTSKKVPTAMIFARCRDGVSHNPTEYCRPEDCAAAAETLLGAYLQYDDIIRKNERR